MRGEIALIGFGEAGSTFARSSAWGPRARAFDIAPSRADAMSQLSVTACTDIAEALRGVSLVLSLVTAEQALPVARACAGLVPADALFCDMNSVSPGPKRAAARAFTEAGRNYVDVAVMAPVMPACMAVPLNISGPDADEAQRRLQGAGFAGTTVVGDTIGRASAIKLVRSVMVKGIEALTAEMMLAAGAEGVVDEVLASLDASEKAAGCTGGWTARADYNLNRMLVHGRRRAAEMAEAARMLRDLGIDPMMTDGTVARQRAFGAVGANPPPDGLQAKLAAIAAAKASNAPDIGEN